MHLLEHSLSWLGTSTAVKCGGVKLVLWAQTCPLSEDFSTCWRQSVFVRSNL